MATALDMIVGGIESGDIEKVADGFNKLTGKNVVPGATKAPIPEDVIEALAFYANKSSYSFDSGVVPVMLDEGSRANDALSLLNFAPQQPKAKKAGVKAKPASPPKASKKKSSKPAAAERAEVAPVAQRSRVKKWEGLPDENKFETQMKAGKGIAPPTAKEMAMYSNVDVSTHGSRPHSNGNELIQATCEFGHQYTARRFETEIKSETADGPKFIICPHCRKAGSGI